MKSVAIFSSVIKPGGGPSGYVYNLLSASKKTPAANYFRFVGRIVDERTQSFRSVSGIMRVIRELRRRIPGIYIPTQGKREIIRSFVGADVAVVHGLVHPKLLSAIRNEVGLLVYMAHSPSIAADEYMMEFSGRKTVPLKQEYDFLNWQEHVCMALADRLVFPSAGSMAAYERAYADIISQGKHVFIPSGVDFNVDEVEIARSGRRCSDGVVKVAFVGRFNLHKGFDLFCEVAKRLVSSRVRFVAAGGGSMKSIDGAVDCVGWVSDIKSFLLSVDVIVVPNRVAYFDLLPLEAAAAGRPIVFTPVGGNVDQANDFPDSILAKSLSIDDLVISVRAAIDEVVRNADWGIRNRDIFLKKYTAELMLNRWDSFISSL